MANADDRHKPYKKPHNVTNRPHDVIDVTIKKLISPTAPGSAISPYANSLDQIMLALQASAVQMDFKIAIP